MSHEVVSRASLRVHVLPAKSQDIRTIAPLRLCPGVDAASCVTKGQQLRRGACSAFVDYFVDNSQCSAGGQVFANAVQNAPQPSSQ
jgi:hypothetical protein